MLVPVRRNDVEAFSPQIRNIDSDPERQAGFDAWHPARLDAVKKADVVRGGEVVKQQGHYIRGEGHEGNGRWVARLNFACEDLARSSQLSLFRNRLRRVMRHAGK